MDTLYIWAACPHNMGSQLLILTEFGPELSRHKKCVKRNALFSELKNCFAKFIHVSTLRYRYGLCLRCIGAACSHNMGSQLLILTEFGPKQYQNAKRVHSAKVNGFRWLFENFRVTSNLRVKVVKRVFRVCHIIKNWNEQIWRTYLYDL